MSIGDKIRELREKSDMSQAELAKKLNMTQQAIDSWERSIADPRKNTIDKLTKIFNVSADHLFGNDTDRARNEITSAISDDKELLEFWNELQDNPNLKILCKQTRHLPPETIKRIIRYIKVVEDEEADEN